MFRTDFLSIIRSPITVLAALLIVS